MLYELNETSLLPKAQFAMAPMLDRAICAYLGHISPQDKDMVELISDPYFKEVGQLLVDPASVKNPSLRIVRYATRFMDDCYVGPEFETPHYREYKELIDNHLKNAIAQQCNLISTEIARVVNGSNKEYCL